MMLKKHSLGFFFIIVVVILVILPNIQYFITYDSVFIKSNIIHNEYSFSNGSNNESNSINEIRSPCYLLLKTHKLSESILERIIKANNDIKKYQCTFITLYWISLGIKSLNYQTRNNLNILKHNNISYLVINDKLFGKYLPHFYNDPQKSKIKWMKKRFEWQTCSLPEMLWYKYNENLLKDYDNIWTMEYDVGWKGNIGDILIKNFDLNKLYNEFGYLGNGLRVENLNSKKKSRWSHRDKRYGFNSSMISSYSHGMPAISRYKAYLLNGMVTQIENSLYTFCEALAPSICEHRLYINKNYEYLNKSCKCANIKDLKPQLFVSIDNWGYAPILTKNTWDIIVNNDIYPNNTLYHRLKF